MKTCKIYIRILVWVVFTLPFTEFVFAGQYKLEPLLDLTEYTAVSVDSVWLEPLSSPIHGNFFVAQKKGAIYLVGKDGARNQEPILDLSVSTNIPNVLSLSAISLHPSFTRPESPGYGIFYTAHTTDFTQGNNKNRLLLSDANSDANIPFSFETVITAWEYDFEKQKLNAHTQREILRVPIKSNHEGIQQLLFDPYKKVWDADYGQLYFSVKHSEDVKGHALYSGAILRIKPMLYGARNYTVSRSNPYVKNPDINNEIVIMGAQNIERFFWAKNSHESIFIQHNNSEQHWLSKAKIGDDLLGESQAESLLEQANPFPSMLFYQGRDFLNLRNNMVFFTLQDSQWRLSSLALEHSSDESKIVEGVITTDSISANSQLNIYQDNKSEIIIFDTLQNKMYALHSMSEKLSEQDVSNLHSNLHSNSTTNSNASKHYVLFASVVVALLVLLVFIKRKSSGAKLAEQTLNKTYVRFEYDLINQKILLFRVNKGKEHLSLSLEKIQRCEVLFNKEVIKVFDAMPENAISNQVDEQMREFFSQQESYKMNDVQTRQIEIVLFDENNRYTICPYLRKGNTRVTGKAYSEVVDVLVELCWIISKRLNQHVTDTRIIPISAFSRVNFATTAKQPDIPLEMEHDESKEDLAIPESTSLLSSQEQLSEEVANSTVVEALDKLVDLHNKGYLSDEEFSQAKTKLLQ